MFSYDMCFVDSVYAITAYEYGPYFKGNTDGNKDVIEIYIAQLSVRNNAFYGTERIFIVSPLCGRRDFADFRTQLFSMHTKFIVGLSYLLGVYNDKYLVKVSFSLRILRQLSEIFEQHTRRPNG